MDMAGSHQPLFGAAAPVGKAAAVSLPVIAIRDPPPSARRLRLDSGKNAQRFEYPVRPPQEAASPGAIQAHLTHVSLVGSATD
jgi:hypothetical protein